MILDSAADLIAKDGVANLSLELIGEKAGVSKTLMYRYFDGLVEFLRELLDREYNSLRQSQNEAAANAETYGELVRSLTRAYLQYIEKRGLIIESLQAYPDVSTLHDPTDFRRTEAVQFLAELVSGSFNISMETAIACTDISFGLPATAGKFLLRSGMDRQKVEDLTVAMMIGGMSGVKHDFTVSSQALKRIKPKSGKIPAVKKRGG